MKKQLLFLTFLLCGSLQADWKDAIINNNFIPESNFAKAVLCGCLTIIPSLLFWNRIVHGSYLNEDCNDTFLKSCWSSINLSANKIMGQRYILSKEDNEVYSRENNNTQVHRTYKRDFISLALTLIGIGATTFCACNINS